MKMKIMDYERGLTFDDSPPSSTAVQVPTAAKRSVVSWQAPILPSPLGINDTPESMYSDARPRTSSSKLAAGGRSILSKLASPLKSRARNVYDFEIRLDEPHRQYAPDDVVKGIVLLTILMPTRITHLTVALHGFVRVLKSPAPIGETITSEPAIPISKSRRSQYTGNGHASLFNDEITLCGEGRLDPSVYEFGFNLRFPSSGIPSSIDVSILQR